MSTWAEFANAAPDLAAFGLERMKGRIVYQATRRLAPGSPGIPVDRGRSAVRVVPGHQSQAPGGRSGRPVRPAHFATVGGPCGRARRVHGSRMARADLPVAPGGHRAA